MPSAMLLSRPCTNTLSLTTPPKQRCTIRKQASPIRHVVYASETQPTTTQDAEQRLPPSTPPPASPQMPFRAITLIAGAGALETAYLTLAKLTNNAVACPTTGPLSGCSSVLNSDWATFFGVPLSLIGFAAYSTVATLSAVAGSRQLAGIDERDDSLSTTVRSVLLGAGITMATSSAFLMYILATQFAGDLCPWCIASAGLSAGLLYASLSGYSRSELTQRAVPLSTVLGTTALVLALNFSNISSSNASGYYEVEYQEPPINTVSSPQAVTLAKRLRDAGARMYGAFWCSHCYEQKESFGKEAMAYFPYIECYPEGFKKGVEIAPVCAAADLKGFPTWVIGDLRFEGEQSFGVLEDAVAKLESKAVVEEIAQTEALSLQQ